MHETTAPTRELAQRLSGTVDGFHVEVAPDKALDAFHHPYAYATGREHSHRVLEVEGSICDG